MHARPLPVACNKCAGPAFDLSEIPVDVQEALHCIYFNPYAPGERFRDRACVHACSVAKASCQQFSRDAGIGKFCCRRNRPACPSRTLCRLLGTDASKALWKIRWELQGKCSGLSVRDYFTFIVDAFSQHNMNVCTPAV